MLYNNGDGAGLLGHVLKDRIVESKHIGSSIS